MKKLLVILALVVVTSSVKAFSYDDEYYEEVSNEQKVEATDEDDETVDDHAEKDEDNLSPTTENTLNMFNTDSQTEDPNAVIQSTSPENEATETQNVTLADIVGILIRQTVTKEVRQIAAELATVYLNPNQVNASPDTNVPVVEVPKALIQTSSTETGATGSVEALGTTLGNIMEDLIKRELVMGVRKIAAEIATEYLNANQVKGSTDDNPLSPNEVYPAVAEDEVPGETSYPYPYYHEKK